MNRFQIKTLVVFTVIFWVFAFASPFLLGPFLPKEFAVCIMVCFLPAGLFSIVLLNRWSFQGGLGRSLGVDPPVTLRESDVKNWWRVNHQVFESKTQRMENETEAMLNELKEVLSGGNYFGNKRHDIARLCREIYWKENERLGLYTQIRKLPGLQTEMLD